MNSTASYNCNLCPRHCSLAEGEAGFCAARCCIDESIVTITYGRTTGLVVDPIEKKPLYHFYPGTQVLSLGSIGCNLACKFCQNWKTARSTDLSTANIEITPDEVVRQAQTAGCRSVAFTYNEPIIGAEFVIETARLCRKAGIKTVAVSNGYISDLWRQPFFDMMDAANIDLKSFSNDFYKQYCSASLEPVLDTLRFLSLSNCWLEITTLLIPGLNDSHAEIEALSQWIVRTLGSETPLHFSAFRPAYQLDSLPSTPPHTLFAARNRALAAGLRYVYTGNIDDPVGQSTVCPQCKQEVIARNRFQVEQSQIDEDGCCKYCGQTIAGWFDV